ncbi:hypothetical protein PCANC_17360 [Puccinia coronata f. sp. avenae]|uniref:Uncharacterized protein n=1 Tax=Puccinia coronata f. sp. avenae TaxID=200324 RepID=A0A2N5U4S0_9BASI|nr:hypothetical protein PCANC_17360 [Puccinia coronata f. sp. avenae]
MSKRDVCELVLIYLSQNGFEDQQRDWRGVEQQITRLERKFCDTLAFKDQTGQGILEEAKELQRQVGDPGNDSGAENFVEAARNCTEGLIRKRCPHFYKLEPVMGNRPSEAPMACMEQGNGNTLDHSPDPSEIEGKECASAGRGSNLNMSSSASKDKALPASLELSGQETQERPSQSQTNCETQQLSAHGGESCLERAASGQNPHGSRRPSTSCAPLGLQVCLHGSARPKRMAESNARMVQAAQDVAKAICNQGNEATSSEPNMRALQLREKELDVKKKEIKVAQQELLANRRKMQAGAFARA